MNRPRVELVSQPRKSLSADDSTRFLFESLSTREWRIVDRRHPSGSVEALVGFVARHNGAYYATRMKHPLESVPFGSLDAVAAFVARGE